MGAYGRNYRLVYKVSPVFMAQANDINATRCMCHVKRKVFVVIIQKQGQIKHHCRTVISVTPFYVTIKTKCLSPKTKW